MAQQQNTLGAPAEGFSQTVTFAANLDNRTPQLGAVGSQVERRRVVGAEKSPGVLHQPGIAPLQANRTVEFLSSIADKIMEPKLKEARLQRYVGGMQMAAAGKQITEIAEEQPWYTRIFGEGDAVAGARAYTQQTKAQEVALTIEEKMPELRKMGLQEANSYFTGLVKSNMTGDAATDVALMQSFNRTLPTAMKKQAREHYIYQQEVASASESAALQSGAGLLQQRAVDLADKKISPEDYELEQATYATVALPSEGRDKESWQKARAGDLILMAEKGQFHAIASFRKSGLMSALTPQQQAQVEKSIQANEAQARARDAEEWAPRLMAIGNLARFGTPGLTPEILMQSIDDLNNDYRTRTGNSLGIMSGAAKEHSMERLSYTIQRELDRQAAEAARRAAAAQAAGDRAQTLQLTQSALATAWASGTMGNVEELTGGIVKHAQAELFGYEKSRALFNRREPGAPLSQSEQAALTALARNTVASKANTLIQTELRSRTQAALQGGAESPGFMSVYSDWKNLNQVSPEAASAMFGTFDKRFRKFDLAFAGNIASLPLAYDMSFGASATVEGRKFSKEEMKQHTGNVVRQLSDWRPEMWGGSRGLRPGQQDYIVSLTKDRAEEYNGMDAKQASALGLTAALQDGLQVVGGYAWQDKRGNFYNRLAASVTVQGEGGRVALSTGAELGNDFGDVVDKMLKESGHKSEQVRIFTSGDNGLMATWIDEGKTRSMALPLKDIANRIAETQVARRPQKRKPGENGALQFGPKVFVPEPEGGNIYIR